MNWHIRLLLPALLLIQGCASWAPEGRGGAVEQQHRLLAWLDSGSRKPLGPEYGLMFEATLLKHQLDLLVVEGAELCFPASVAQAKLRENRILRELEGELVDDAAIDIEIQQQFLHTLERRLDGVKQGGRCTTGSTGEMNDNLLSQGLLPLLNNNNQFATDSSELTPAYQQQLISALPLLQNSQAFLMIRGHTDTRGGDVYNQTLSLKRANRVARFLTEHGVSPQRIWVGGFADRVHFARGSSDEHHHSNRRVTIHLLNQTHFNMQRLTP